LLVFFGLGNSVTKQEQNDQILHSAAVGDVATNWEFLLETIEVTLLHLARCPDYRGRVLTDRMSFPIMMRALHSLFRYQFGGEFVAKGSQYSKLSKEIYRLRDERNRIVHATWLDSKGGITAKVSASPHKMTAVEKTVEVADIRAIAEQIAQTHEELSDFVTNQCESAPSPEKYELPRRENNLPPDQNR